MNIVLPLAISFFTFQQIAYLVDSYEGKTKEYDFLRYALFVTFFPQLIAGPIVHHTEMMPQFANLRSRFINPKNIALGMFLLSVGLFKKVVIADFLSPYVAQIFDVIAKPTFLETWIGAFAYTFQLYFDFSGYTDMARGLSSLYGFTLPMEEGIPVTFAFAHSLFRFVRRFLSLLFDRLPPKRATGRLLVGLSLFLSMVIFRPQPSFWLFSLPLLLLLVFFAYYPARGKMHPWLSSLLFLFFLAPAAMGALIMLYKLAE